MAIKGKAKIGIIGATGYTGIELCKIIARHPNANIVFLTSQTYANKRIHEVFPELIGTTEHRLIPLEDGVERRADLVFSCLPHTKSAEVCLRFHERKIRVVDLSADFRLQNQNDYKAWYGMNHPDTEVLKSAVFGMPELYRSKIKSSKLTANPGCFTTGILLPLIPLVHAKAVDPTSVIIDSKTGVSGAGRALKISSLFAEANENITPYNVGRQHRHLPEVEQEVSREAGKKVKVIFTPHLLPVNRGILTTMYVKLSKASFAGKIEQIFQNAFKKAFGIRLLGETMPQLKNVTHTNYCDIGWKAVPGSNTVIVVSAIDNLRRGASGQAVQNMNLMLGFPEGTGLE